MMKTVRIKPLVAVAVATATLAACSGSGSQTPAASDNPSTKSATGTATGGRAPIKASAITVYTVDNTTGARTTAATTTSTANGTFSVSFNCPATSQVYFESVGGDAGGGGANTAIDLVNVSLPCATLANGFSVNIDEATTAAAAYALAGSFFSNTAGLAATPTGIPAAFTQAQSYADSTSGLTKSPLAGQAQPAINSLANSLAACVNSTGPTSAQCTNLFSAASVSNVTAPANTLQAAVGVAYYPLAVNAANVYNTASANTIYTPAFSTAPADWSLQLTTLVQKQNVTQNVDLPSDTFAWKDSQGLSRYAVLAHNDGARLAGGSYGGELREFDYQLPTGVPRVIKGNPGDGASGFGYIVSHEHGGEGGADGTSCTNGIYHASGYGEGYDTSLLGHLRGGSFTRPFTGRNHSILIFSQTYPVYCSQNNVAAAQYEVPVQYGFAFSNGQDNPLWAVTYNVGGATVYQADGSQRPTAIAEGDIQDDSRAPYGQLNFDGSAPGQNAGATVDGTGWGDNYKFLTTSTPLSLSSTWTWTAANTVPYAYNWTTPAADAEMGTVATQITVPIATAAGNNGNSAQSGNGVQAGGDAGFISPPHGTSADGNQTCSDGYTVPCTYNWSYQLSVDQLNFVDPSTVDYDRFAWGTPYGFLGQATYADYVSSTYVSPPSWQYQSYSLWTVFGQHSTTATTRQVTQMETIESLTLGGTNGTTPAASGPLGIADPTLTHYSPAGWDPVYGALTFITGNNGTVNATIGVATNQTLVNPLIVVRSFTGSAASGYPTHVSLDGAELIADKDYLPSLWTAKGQLWLTLNRSLAAGSHTLSIQ